MFPPSDSFVSETTWNIFLQDEYKLLEPLTAFGTIRLDRHPLTDFNISYRASLLYRVLTHHVLFTTIGRTFRDPAFTESHSDVLTPTRSAGIRLRLFGREDVDPEVLHSYELGYRALFFDRLKTDAIVSYHEAIDLMEFATEGKIVGGIVPTPNDGRGRHVTTTVELAGELFVTSWLNLFTNYTYMDRQREKRVVENDFSPRHKENFGFSLTGKARAHTVMLDFFASFVDKIDAPGALGPKMPAYSLLNLRVAYAYRDWAEASLAVYNLGHDVHREMSRGEPIGTQILTKTSLKF